tara:strand:+ start:2644 stop:3018 length:375 start_codon:yes stop_codon:yes gene_type:complete
MRNLYCLFNGDDEIVLLRLTEEGLDLLEVPFEEDDSTSKIFEDVYGMNISWNYKGVIGSKTNTLEGDVVYVASANVLYNVRHETEELEKVALKDLEHFTLTKRAEQMLSLVTDKELKSFRIWRG